MHPFQSDMEAGIKVLCGKRTEPGIPGLGFQKFKRHQTMDA